MEFERSQMLFLFQYLPLLQGKAIAMIFEKRSTRTRMSTETGARFVLYQHLRGDLTGNCVAFTAFRTENSVTACVLVVFSALIQLMSVIVNRNKRSAGRQIFRASLWQNAELHPLGAERGFILSQYYRKLQVILLWFYSLYQHKSIHVIILLK